MKAWLAAALCGLSLNAAAATPDSGKNMQDLQFNTPQEVKENIDPLPKEDIQRFVTAIAIIHHYYIYNISDNVLFNSAIRGMVAGLDPHSSFLDADDIKELQTTVTGKFVGIGVELTLHDGLLKVISPLDGSPAQQAGLKPNDLIIKVGNTLVRDMSLSEAIKQIKGTAGTTVNLTVMREGSDKPIDFKVVRNTVTVEAVKSKMLSDGYGYVRLTFFQGDGANELANAIQKLKKQSNGKLKGLVFDLRNNPGGLLDMAGTVADDFLDSKEMGKYNDVIVSTKGRIQGSDMVIKAKPGDLIDGTPMVVLINGGSASASEIVAGALQDYKRAIIMGTRSFGKGSVQTVLPINDQNALKLTTALYYTPAGRVIQAKGIVPDVIVPQLDITNSGKTKAMFNYDESDFSNHLVGAEELKKTRDDAEKSQAMINDELKIAKEDYQLYQALMTLKGLNATVIN